MTTTIGEVLDQLKRAIDETDAARVFAADLHPEHNPELVNRIHAARTLLDTEYRRLKAEREEVAQ